MKAKIYTVEIESDNGCVLIDDLKLSRRDALKEVRQRGGDWRSVEIEVDILVDKRIKTIDIGGL